MPTSAAQNASSPANCIAGVSIPRPINRATRKRNPIRRTTTPPRSSPLIPSWYSMSSALALDLSLSDFGADVLGGVSRKLCDFWGSLVVSPVSESLGMGM